MRDAAAVWQELDAAIGRLAVIETEVGMTFALAALHAESTQECLHNRQLARTAYDTAQKWMNRTKFKGDEEKVLCSKLLILGSALRRLGDPAMPAESSDRKTLS
jgi:hypothetical protein